jgi:hypothetical protein
VSLNKPRRLSIADMADKSGWGSLWREYNC